MSGHEVGSKTNGPDLRIPDADAGEGPHFREPWEARAFAMAVALTRTKHMTWDAFRDRLIAEIGSATAADCAGAHQDYYRHWFKALEALAIEKGFATQDELLD